MTPTAPLKQAYKQWKQQKHISKQKHGSLFVGITQVLTNADKKMSKSGNQSPVFY